jgi:hypothetical protein
MYVRVQINNLLEQISNLLEDLSDEQYSLPLSIFSNASIGQHTRHIIEFFLELFKGYDQGVVDYDNRKRSHAIETNRQCALLKLQEVADQLARPDKELWLMADFESVEPSVEVSLVRKAGCSTARIRTNYQRELVYNLEHTVHHMALLRIGVSALGDLTLPENFGVALSTQKFRKTCVQ